MAQLLGEAEADLLDLVARELVCAGHVFGIVLGDAAVGGIVEMPGVGEWFGRLSRLLLGVLS